MEHVDHVVVGLGALGSATAYQLARRGADVLGLEQFELGHVRGASHDTSRIIRRAYERPEYVRLADAAYRDWAEFEEVSGEHLVTRTGGVTFCPPTAPAPLADYLHSLRVCGVEHEELDAAAMRELVPQFAVPEGVGAVWTADSGIVHANRSVAALQMHARMFGARLRDRCPVTSLQEDADGVVLQTAQGPVHAGLVVLCTDAWTNRLLAPLGAQVPMRVMQEQVTYFKPDRPAEFEIGRFPIWIWEDQVCYYGFPCFGEPTIKAARDVSEVLMGTDERTFVPSPTRFDELRAFMATTLPGSGVPLRTVTCQYALTPDRHFVLDSVPGHPRLHLGLGAGHAFKFTPTMGRVLADLATTGSSTEDLSLFRADRPALRDPMPVGAA
ncbi:N-methyl-L-tryptophan oxidase [Nakamurella flavida]|uniref:N-methyl-L-tryptophan oxidase n=1 Tax=Nakamurella flavida TaxID=363630 RepID=A0A938YP69_9ACTN|nr:N-methyl-L-tryptophan oxidase [Nakamurella flavida]MBM9476663.1 N-methyl-L-tryptophan oxidase [Nakamurella flavida]MDP9778899.1 sarcosine oxidase [Nakamurella flavida]